MKKRVITLILAFIMVTMSVAGCGRSENDKKDEPAAERTEEINNADEESDAVESTDEVEVTEPEDTNQENVDSTDSDEVVDTADESESDEAEETDIADEEMNEYGLTETQMQKLYECVKEAVLTGYIEPNGISPEELQWPKPDDESDVAAWNYLAIMYRNYKNSAVKYDSTGFDFEKPNDSMCQLMNSILDGMISWSEIYSEKIYKVRLLRLPLDKLFPENIDFTS